MSELSNPNINTDNNSENTSTLVLKYMNLVKIKAFKAKALSRRPDIDADDLISEGFLGLLGAIRTFDEQKGNFASYANVCISNRIKNVAFANQVTTSLDDDFDFTQTADKQLTDEIVIEKESQSEIFAKLDEILSELESKVFVLYLESYSYSAIAKRLGLSAKTVDNALSRARTKLRKAYRNPKLNL